MAENSYLFLKANGEDIHGESSVTSMGRQDSIECMYFEDSVRTARERSTGRASGRRTYEPVKIIKKIDKSSPLLARALCNNEVIEASWKFYRPNPAGDGTTQHFFTVAIADGRVSHIRRVSPDSTDPASSHAPEHEEVGFVFHTIRWVYEPDGVEHEDRWDDQA